MSGRKRETCSIGYKLKEGFLSYVILLDQFSRHIYRDSQSYQTTLAFRKFENICFAAYTSIPCGNIICFDAFTAF